MSDLHPLHQTVVFEEWSPLKPFSLTELCMSNMKNIRLSKQKQYKTSTRLKNPETSCWTKIRSLNNKLLVQKTDKEGKYSYLHKDSSWRNTLPSTDDCSQLHIS